MVCKKQLADQNICFKVLGQVNSSSAWCENSGLQSSQHAFLRAIVFAVVWVLAATKLRHAPVLPQQMIKKSLNDTQPSNAFAVALAAAHPSSPISCRSADHDRRFIHLPLLLHRNARLPLRLRQETASGRESHDSAMCAMRHKLFLLTNTSFFSITGIVFQFRGKEGEEKEGKGRQRRPEHTLK